MPARRAHLGAPGETTEGESVATPGHFSLDTAIGDILDHAEARAVLARFLPELAGQGVPDAARSIALCNILAYVGDVFPDPACEVLGQELEAIIIVEETA